jgi:hypothetical protein
MKNRTWWSHFAVGAALAALGAIAGISTTHAAMDSQDAHRTAVYQKHIEACRTDIELMRIAINDAATGDIQTATELNQEAKNC